MKRAFCTFFAIVVFQAPSLMAQTMTVCQKELVDHSEKCIVGSSIKPELHCQMREENRIKDRRHLNSHLARLNDYRCEIGTDFDHLKDIFKDANKKNTIKKSCVASAIKRIPEIDSPRRLTCNTNSEVPRAHGYKIKERGNSFYNQNDICVTREVSDYVAETINESIKCVNALNKKLSPNLKPISADIIFNKINNESSFGFFLQSSAGIGLTQLTTVAAREMDEKGQKGRRYRDTMKSVFNFEGPLNGLDADIANACENINNIINFDLEYVEVEEERDGEKVTVLSARHCQLMGMGEGLARNAFYGLALFSHNRSTHGSNTLDILQDNSSGYGFDLEANSDSSKILEVINMVAFGRDGNSMVKAVMDRIQNRVKNGDIPKRQVVHRPPSAAQKQEQINDVRNELARLSSMHRRSNNEKEKKDIVRIQKGLVERYQELRSNMQELQQKEEKLQQLLREYAGEPRQGRAVDTILQDIQETAQMLAEKDLRSRMQRYASFINRSEEGMSQEEWQEGLTRIMNEVAESADAPEALRKDPKKIREELGLLARAASNPSQNQEALSDWLVGEIVRLGTIRNNMTLSRDRIRQLMAEYENSSLPPRSREEIQEEINSMYPKKEEKKVESINDLSYEQFLEMAYDENDYIKETVQKMCEFHTYHEESTLEIDSSNQCKNKEFLFSLDINKLMGEECIH